MHEAQRCVSCTYVPIAYSRPAPAAVARAPVYSANTLGIGVEVIALPRRGMDAGATALARDFPSVAALSREEWQALLTESLDPVRHAEETRLYEATFDDLPAVRAMNEAYEAHLRRAEQEAGTLERLIQR